jgi:hypothetical protein
MFVRKGKIYMQLQYLLLCTTWTSGTDPVVNPAGRFVWKLTPSVSHREELLIYNRHIRSVINRLVLYILWHVDPLLDNDHEISSYTIAIAK